METQSEWYNHTDKTINQHKDILGKKGAKKYKLDLLLRIAKRVDYFSSICGECQMLQPDIARLTQDLGDVVNISREARKSYFKKINNITKHLQKQHKLVTPGQYMGMWSGIGTAIGLGIGAALDNISAGMAIGIGIGLVVGSYLDKKAKKEGKVI
jgi:hypothetical protein